MMLMHPSATTSLKPSARWTALLLVFAMTVSPGDAQAQNGLTWRDEWRRVGPVEYVLAPTLLAGSALVTFVIPPPSEPLWTRPLLFDAMARSALRSRSDRGRAVAGTISDLSLLFSGVQSLVIEPVLVAGVGYKSWDVAWQMHVIGGQSYAFTVLLNSLSKRIFARQRPYALECIEDQDYNSSCAGSDRFRSFYSGHSAFTAAGAGLVCAHHTHVPLYGGNWGDRGACLASVGLTLLTGAMRITADRHWATDVFVGHIVGFTTGFLIPSLIYYNGLRDEPVEGTEQAQRASKPVVISWGGTF